MIDFPEVETVYGCLEPFLKKFDTLARRSRFTGSSRAAPSLAKRMWREMTGTGGTDSAFS